MGYITLEEGLLGQLRAVSERVEIRDSSGRVLGHFTPAELSGYDKVKAIIDSGELDRRWEDEAAKATPIAPLLDRLRAMEKLG